MSQDISSIIAGWDFTPDEIQVRTIVADDGTERIQMRVDLGLLQMMMTGRPDGQRPHGFESLLEYYESVQEAAAAAGNDFALDHDDCSALMREGLQYYHRYLAAFHLQKYDLVSRDTERNLRLFRFAVAHAARQRDKLEFDQYRPYVTMMLARARAHEALIRSDYPGALEKIDEGVGRIRQFLREYQREEQESDCAEIGFLLRWRRDLERERPASPIDHMEHQLELAVAREDYEEAARLRDQIKRLKDAQTEQSRRP